MDIFVMVIGATVVLMILLGFIISFMFLYTNRQQRHRLEIDQVKARYDQEILKTQLEIKEQTLRGISEELHDHFGQMLSLVILNLSALDLKDQVYTAQRVEDVTQLVEKVVSDLRDLSKTLDPENIAKFGLHEVIRFDLDIMKKTGQYATSLQVTGHAASLEHSKEIIIYRIVQEALHNITKHAHADSISLNLDYSDAQLELEIADNGRGFNPALLETRGLTERGSGLHNLRKKADLIGANLEIRSIPTEGTSIRMRIPLDPSKDHKLRGV